MQKVYKEFLGLTRQFKINMVLDGSLFLFVTVAKQDKTVGFVIKG